MSVFVSPLSESDTGSPASLQAQQVFYTRRLEAIRAKIRHLEERLRPGSVRYNPHLFEIWQGELAYWRQQEQDVTARLEQLGANLQGI